MATFKQQISILQLTLAMFNAAPGRVFLDKLSLALDEKDTIASLADNFAGNDLFFGKHYPPFSYFENPTLFINQIIQDFTDNKLSSSNREKAVQFITERMENGMAEDELIGEITQLLSAIPYSDRDWGEIALFYDSVAISIIIDNLVGNTIAKDKKDLVANDLLNQLKAGQSFGKMVEGLINTLDSFDHSDAVWGDVATLFDNKIEISKYFSIEKKSSLTYFPLLKTVLNNITSDKESVTQAKTDVDSILAANFNLSDLDGNNGFRLAGITEKDYSGSSVSSAGDFNGDGFNDFMIGAPKADPNGSRSGSVYVVFGQSTYPNSLFPLSALNGKNGFRIDGLEEYDQLGVPVNSAGDVNGDGFSDLIISTRNAGNLYGSGISYVILGRSFPIESFNLSELNGKNGFRLVGENEYDYSGHSVSSAGDINGDGFDDLIIGAPGTYANKIASSCYILFGKSSSFEATINLSELNGKNGFRIDGPLTSRTGQQVRKIGDINGDGFDDIAFYSLNYETESYASIHVLFGKASNFDANVNVNVNVNDINGKNGFSINGARISHNPGDINGDGFNDLVISTYPDSFKSLSFVYVIYGKNAEFPRTLDINNLSPNDGFQLTIPGLTGNIGNLISIGDFNSDSFDDLIIEIFAEYGNDDPKISYVVYGQPSNLVTEINLSNLKGSDGFQVNRDNQDIFARSINNIGDINGDGFDDLIIGAAYADPDGKYNAGSSYVLFGGSSVGEVIHRGSTGVDFLIGTPSDDRFTAGIGDDSMDGKGEKDVFHGGAGNDKMMISDLNFQLVDGGSGQDTLSLEGHQLNFDLANFRNRINSIETINLTGSGDNTLTFSALDLLNLSDTSNTLTVDGNTGDHVVVRHGNWVNNGIKEGYQIYSYNAAVLKVGINVATEFL